MFGGMDGFGVPTPEQQPSPRVQPTAAAPEAANSGAAGLNIIDTKVLGKPPAFSGEEHAWAEWSWVFLFLIPI